MDVEAEAAVGHHQHQRTVIGHELGQVPQPPDQVRDVLDDV